MGVMGSLILRTQRNLIVYEAAVNYQIKADLPAYIISSAMVVWAINISFLLQHTTTLTPSIHESSAKVAVHSILKTALQCLQKIAK